MKCEVCLPLLEEYFDSELAEHEAAQVSAHLITCVSCASEADGLSAEQEIYSRYDRALEVAPAIWDAIAARTAAEAREVREVTGSRPRWRDRFAGLFTAPSLGWSFAGALAVLLVAAIIGLAYLKVHQPATRSDIVKDGNAEPVNSPDKRGLGKESSLAADVPPEAGPSSDKEKSLVKAFSNSRRRPAANATVAAANQSDVLFSDVAYSAVEEQETQTHIEQAQNLLRSVRNIEVSDDDGEIDVTYEKALSRRLLNENIVLRRDAEMSGKFPVKTLLSSLEPFLLDIANLPDNAAPDDLRVIKERVQKTEIVAALRTY